MSRIHSAKVKNCICRYTIDRHEQEKEQRIEELVDAYKLVGLDGDFALEIRRRR